MSQIAVHHEDLARTFNRDALFRKVGLMVGLALMGLLYVTRSQSDGFELRLIVQAATLTAVTVLATIFVPWHRLPQSVQATPPLAFLVVAFLAREAATGAESVYAQLVLLPVVWLAVYGSSRELIGGVVGVAAALLAPALIPGGEPVDWRRATILIGMASGLGFALHVFFARLRTQADHRDDVILIDDLTGAINPRGWHDELEKAVAEAGRTHDPVSVAVLDLDDFKAFNDAHGYEAGDRALKEASAMWRTELRESDVLARLGGDEFGLILRGCAIQAALRAVVRFCHALPSGLTCSVGVATWDRKEPAHELVARANSARYEARDRGGARPVMSTR